MYLADREKPFEPFPMQVLQASTVFGTRPNISSTIFPTVRMSVLPPIAKHSVKAPNPQTRKFKLNAAFKMHNWTDIRGFACYTS